MPKFRGIEQTYIIRSLTAAAQFLSDLDLGPENNAIAAAWQSGGDNIKTLAAARTDAQLLKAVKDTQANGAFTFVAPVLELHAQLNTNGQGLAIAQNLARWGGLQDARSIGLFPVDNEVQAHLQRYPQSKSLQVDLPSPFERYSLVTDKHELRNPQLNAQLDEVLAPFKEKLELRKRGKGRAGTGKDSQVGLIFESTVEAAQAVAEAFADRKVVDSHDRQVAIAGPHSRRLRDLQNNSPEISR